MERSSWVELGRVYHVLAFETELASSWLRLVGEEPTPALFQPEMFEVVSSVIPSAWVVTSPKPGCLSLEPEPWSRPGFWESFFDAEPEAVARFEEYRNAIVASDP